MNLSFLRLPTEERRLYIDQAATRRNLSSVIMEKDFWVCWLSVNIIYSSRALSETGQRPSKRALLRPGDACDIIGRYTECLL